MEYIGGNEHQWDKVDPDYMSIFGLTYMLKEAGVTYNSKHVFYYLVPGLDMTNGLTKVYYDAEVMEMCSVGLRHGIIEVFHICGVDDKGDTGCFSNKGFKNVVNEDELESSSSDSDRTEDNDDSCDASYLPEKDILGSSSDEDSQQVREESMYIKEGRGKNQLNEGTSKPSRPCESINVPLSRGWESEKGQNALEGSDMETDDSIAIIESYVNIMENICDQGGNMNLERLIALEGSDMEMDDTIEKTEGYLDKTEIICAQGGTIENMEEESDASCAATVPLSIDWESEKGKNALAKSDMDTDGSEEENDGGCASSNVYVEDIKGITNKERPEEDELVVKFVLDNSDACIVNRGKSLEATTKGLRASNDGLASLDLGIVESMTEIAENLEDPSKQSAEEPMENLLNNGEGHMKETASINNKVKEFTRQVYRRKVVEKKVTQDAVSHEETLLHSENNPIVEACKVDTNEVVDNDGLEATTKGLRASNDGLASLDLGIVENMTEIAENLEDPSKLNAEEPMETLLNKGEEGHMKETASINNKVKEFTRQVYRRKVVEKKVAQDAVSHEETLLHSEKNNPIVEACKVDTNEVVDNEKKTLNLNNASDEADTEDHLNDGEKLRLNSPVEVRLEGSSIEKKMAPEDHSGSVTAKDDPGLSPGDDEPGTKDHVDITGSDVNFERVGNPADWMSLSNKSEKQKVENKGPVELVMEVIENPEPSKKSKLAKRTDSMGMIFMCTSETKKDCFRYRVLGAPAGKKYMVSKIYKGMRLFLFDVELRMMYGIFKAAGPGGCNIEPRAFKSHFPSQVRFSILEDCVPLAEERFKKVLKDNYYTEHKFNCQLNSVQVKNLCNLFHEANTKLECAKVFGKNQRVAATSSSAWLDRTWVEGSQGVQEDSRNTPMVINDSYHGCPAYRRESDMHVAPMILYKPVIAFSPLSGTYSYDRVFGVDPGYPDLVYDPYRREVRVLDYDINRSIGGRSRHPGARE